MIGLLLLAASPVALQEPASPPPCVPVPADRLAPTASAIEKHRALRQALAEPMPDAPTMVMLHGEGGHLATDEYSIILARTADGLWRGTAVGRSKIWVEGAPFRPMDRAEWVLDQAAGQRLDEVIARNCPFDRAAADRATSGPPPRGYISEQMDVVTPGHAPYSFFVGEGGESIAAMIRPPR